MDTEPPYASGVSRLRLIYRFAAPRPTARVLVIGCAEAARAAFDTEAWSVDQADPGCVDRTGGYDVVALPGTLDDGPAAPLLRAALVALNPGGRVVGHLANAGALRSLQSALHLRRRPGATALRLQRGLMATGFVDAECFFVEPRIDSPMALVPVHRDAARAHFLRAIRRTRRHYSGVGYLLRLALAWAGYGGSLQPQLFFWARRPC